MWRARLVADLAAHGLTQSLKKSVGKYNARVCHMQALWEYWTRLETSRLGWSGTARFPIEMVEVPNT
jgi:hypothetical protein